jgi:hypothetical protein
MVAQAIGADQQVDILIKGLRQGFFRQVHRHHKQPMLHRDLSLHQQGSCGLARGYSVTPAFL